MKTPTFSSRWPHRVAIISEPDRVNDAWHWLYGRAVNNGMTPTELFTTYSNHEFGFKDPKVAMEFKLRFG